MLELRLDELARMIQRRERSLNLAGLHDPPQVMIIEPLQHGEHATGPVSRGVSRIDQMKVGIEGLANEPLNWVALGERVVIKQQRLAPIEPEGLPFGDIVQSVLEAFAVAPTPSMRALCAHTLEVVRGPAASRLLDEACRIAKRTRLLSACNQKGKISPGCSHLDRH